MINIETRMFECTQVASFEERSCKLRSAGVMGYANDYANQQNDFYNATGWPMRTLMH